ncbi:MAG: rRNA maturation RNase YbeY [Planctomycetota bacterium]
MHGVIVYVRREFKDIRCSVQKLGKLVRSACGRFGLADVTVSIAVVDNSHIRKLNARFLNRKTVTDCLSFDLSQPRDNHRWFELVVNGEKAKREAAKRGHSAQAELALYVIHGLLHNLGFDDRLTAQAKKMHRLEDEILQQHGFGQVYNRKNKVAMGKRLKKC